MPHCLILAPFPLVIARHGGQVRATSLAHALRHAGWQVDTVGIYHAEHFPIEERGAHDIVLTDPAIFRRGLDDVLFLDFNIARAAAADPVLVARLRALLIQLRPDIVQVEHPWDWLVLQHALPSGPRPRIVYSSHNIEWRTRPPMFEWGLERPGSADLVEATRLLELQFSRAADLVLSISDLEADIIAAEAGRPVSYVPPVSDLAWSGQTVHDTYRQATWDRRCRYAALMGSAFWPNVEGFFTMFPDGLGSLARNERIWVAGDLGAAIEGDPRFGDFLTLNQTRFHAWGYIADADKQAFFNAASCVIVPVTLGGGAKLKMADALASGRPVIATSHALEGYGPLLQDVLGRGVYVADTPEAFRGLVRQALRGGLAACPPEMKQRLSPQRLSDNLARLYDCLLAPVDAVHGLSRPSAPP